MGRRRKAGNEWLPDRVYPGKSAYEYRPDRTTCVRLCALDAPRRILLKRYAEELSKFEVIEGSFEFLVDLFINSLEFRALAARTQKDYQRYRSTVLKVFGKMQAARIRPEHIRRYMDIRGEQTQVQANREHSFMSKVFSWGYERGRVPVNPCHGVKKFTEAGRDRYITDAEYQAVYSHANPYIQAAMEISYCCATRQGDVLNLTRQQLRDEGIFIKQGKTNKAQIKRWSDRLRAALKLLQRQPTIAHSGYLFVDDHGQRITGHKLRQWWREARDAAQGAMRKEHEDDGILFDFTFHDIKAKSISDYEGDKQQFSGHKTRSQVLVYDRKTPVVDTHN